MPARQEPRVDGEPHGGPPAVTGPNRFRPQPSELCEAGERVLRDLPLGAVATLQACEQEQARHTKLNDAVAKVVAKSPYVAWRCLPDTVDPRGPKGQ
jgi:hypothetical protein